MCNSFVSIKGYENLYGINKQGEVFSYRSRKVLKPIIKNTGYACVSLYDISGRYKSKYIHILVAETFLGKENKGLVVNHKDLNKLNNCVDNLEFITQEQNIYHSKINGKQIRNKGKDNKKSKEVLQYDLQGHLIRVWNSVMDIERELGIKSNYVSNCALGKCKTSCGFIWKYKGTEE